MKALYFDSTYLFRLYFRDPGADQVRTLAEGAEGLVTAWHGRAEIASILLRKRRESSISDAVAELIQRQITLDMSNGLIRFLPLSGNVMTRLESTLSTAPANTNLRAADALHLACAAEHGFTEVHSNDRLFLAAAPLFHLIGRNVIP